MNVCVPGCVKRTIISAGKHHVNHKQMQLDKPSESFRMNEMNSLSFYRWENQTLKR